MCYAYDEQRELICCEAVKILQINGGVGKKNVTDGSEWIYSMAQSEDGESWHFD